MLDVSASDRLTPLVIPAAYEHVVERVRRMIFLGEVLPGERLPSERALAEAFQVSRVTVREALRTLQGEGLVTTRRGSSGGAIVRSDTVPLAESRLRLATEYPRMLENHEFRLAIEPMAAYLAAERRTSKDIDRMRAGNDRLGASENIAAFRQADSAFHLAVASASGNEKLRQAVEDARSNLFVNFDLQEYQVMQATSADGHNAVIDAIADRNAQAASEAMRAHLKQSWSEIVAVMEGRVS